MDVEWDSAKAVSNLEKHGVDVADTVRATFGRTAKLAESSVKAMVVSGMRSDYDFSEARRGPVITPSAGKTRITIRIDEDILEWFKAQVHAAGGGSYQAEINAALRTFIESRREPLESTLRRVIREELQEPDLPLPLDE